MNTHVVIMAGGVGSRLWPVSTPKMPKQFIDLLGVGRSLIQLTVERFLPVCDCSRIWVVTSANYADTVRKQLPQIPDDQILEEPVARNTAPCIAYACWKIRKRDPEANVIVTPSDAIVMNTGKFADNVRKALNFTEKEDAIVTIGIHPDRPETGYGYICAASPEEDTIVKVNEFKEKPDRTTAESYVSSGNYFWNAGIFVWSVRTIVDQFRKYSPQIAGMMDRLEPSMDTPEEKSSLATLFPQCDKISIDYAVMEKSDSIYVIASDLEWSDLGTWSSMAGKIESDDCGNKSVGKDVRLYGCENCIVHTGATGTAIIDGLKDYIIARSGDDLLVCPKSDEQKIREFSSEKELH